MGRPKLPAQAKRIRVPVNASPRIVDWVDSQVGVGKRWQTRSHAFEFAVAQLMEAEEKGSRRD